MKMKILSSDGELLAELGPGESFPISDGMTAEHAEAPKTTVGAQVHVLWWTYGDGSGQNVSRVYTDFSRAEADFALLSEHSTVQWRLSSLPLTS